MNFTTREVGPKEALELLSSNSVNRKLSVRNIEYLTQQIQSGNYRETGDTIKISKSGRLLDGQHRLNAIIKANKSINLTFCTGLEDEIFDVLDTGKIRTASDIMSIKNIPNAHEVTAAATFLLKYNKGGLFLGRKISNTDVLQTVMDNPEIVDIVKIVCTENKKFRMISSSMIAALYYLFSKKNHQLTEDFFNKYYTGLGISREDPIYILRDRLIRDSVNKIKIPLVYKMSLMASAWNAFRLNKTIKRLDWELNVFPKIK